MIQQMTCALMGLCVSGAVLAQSGEGQASTIEQSEDAPAKQVEALAAGETKVLEAVVIEVEGSVRWRATEDEEFRALEVDDIVQPGAEIRTALRSGAKIRVGHNATVDIHSVSRVVIPQIVQDGDTLRTRAAVRRGRADFKVDKVGLVNDFQVITPSTTLAVRGTWFSIAHGGLLGTTIEMFDPGEISAAEVRYFTRMQRSVVVTAGQRTGERAPDPVANAMFDTFSPPPDEATAGNQEQTRAGAANARRDKTQLAFDTQRATEYAADSAARTQVGLGVTPEDPRRRKGGSFEPNIFPDLPPGLSGGSGNSGDR